MKNIVVCCRNCIIFSSQFKWGTSVVCVCVCVLSIVYRIFFSSVILRYGLFGLISVILYLFFVSSHTFGAGKYLRSVREKRVGSKFIFYSFEVQTKPKSNILFQINRKKQDFYMKITKPWCRLSEKRMSLINSELNNELENAW